MIKKDSTDYSLYLVTDRELAGRRPLCQIVEAAIHGGVTVVQYREKCTGTRQMIKEALEIAFFVHAHNFPLIIMIAWISLLPSVQMEFISGRRICLILSPAKLLEPKKLLGYL